MGITAWFDNFGEAFMEYKEHVIFYHAMALLKFHNTQTVYKAPFRYLNIWRLHPNYHKTVEEAWQKSGANDGNVIVVLYAKLKEVKNYLEYFMSSFLATLAIELLHMRDLWTKFLVVYMLLLTMWYI